MMRAGRAATPPRADRAATCYKSVMLPSRPVDPGPALTRRRELGGRSARSLLMTILGEFVLPADSPAQTTALVRALAMHGVAEKSARQALARTAAEGWLTPLREGRRVRWALTARGRTLLTEGASRIYSFGRRHRHWQHTWLLVLVTVPEPRRDLRHRLRTRMTWAGFGSLAPGVWVSPDVGREAEAATILADLGLAAEAVSFTASGGTIGSASSVAAQAWDMSAVAKSYQAFLDPQLPAELLPGDWTGAAAARLFHRRHAEWTPGAQRRWAALAAEEESGG